MGKFFVTEENKKLEDKVWREFLDQIRRKIDSKDIDKILEMLLSPFERKEIVRRLAVISLLSEGRTYRKISEILGVSHQTVRAIKKCIFENSQTYYPYHKKEKVSELQSSSSFMDDLKEFLSNIPASKNVNISRGRYKKY